MLAALWVAGLAFVLNRVVAAALSFRGIESWVLSVWLSVVLVAIWSGLSWQRASARPHGAEHASATAHDAEHASAGWHDAEHASAERGNDALDMWFGPVTGHVRAVAISGVIGAAAAGAGAACRRGAVRLELPAPEAGCVPGLGSGARLDAHRSPPRPRHRAPRDRLRGLRPDGRHDGRLRARGRPRCGARGGVERRRAARARVRPGLVRRARRLVSDDSRPPQDELCEAAAFYTYLKAHSTLGLWPSIPLTCASSTASRPVNRLTCSSRRGQPEARLPLALQPHRDLYAGHPGVRRGECRLRARVQPLRRHRALGASAVADGMLLHNSTSSRSRQ